MTRASTALGEPPDDLSGFPARSTGGTWYRAHAAGLGPWWFAQANSNDGTTGGRFDLPPAVPDGTCYVSNDIEAAVRERLGEIALGFRTLPASLLAGTAVAGLEATDRPRASPASTGPRRAQLAHTVSQKAAGTITRELGNCVDYPLTRRWAIAFHRDRFGGLHYQPRFTPGRSTAQAWFGPKGTHDLPFVNVAGWKQSLPGVTTIGLLDADKSEIHAPTDLVD